MNILLKKFPILFLGFFSLNAGKNKINQREIDNIRQKWGEFCAHVYEKENLRDPQKEAQDDSEVFLKSMAFFIAYPEKIKTWKLIHQAFICDSLSMVYQVPEESDNFFEFLNMEDDKILQLFLSPNEIKMICLSLPKNHLPMNSFIIGRKINFTYEYWYNLSCKIINKRNKRPSDLSKVFFSKKYYNDSPVAKKGYEIDGYIPGSNMFDFFMECKNHLESSDFLEKLTLRDEALYLLYIKNIIRIFKKKYTQYPNYNFFYDKIIDCSLKQYKVYKPFEKSEDKQINIVIKPMKFMISVESSDKKKWVNDIYCETKNEQLLKNIQKIYHSVEEKYNGIMLEREKIITSPKAPRTLSNTSFFLTNNVLYDCHLNSLRDGIKFGIKFFWLSTLVNNEDNKFTIKFFKTYFKMEVLKYIFGTSMIDYFNFQYWGFNDLEILQKNYTQLFPYVKYYFDPSYGETNFVFKENTNLLNALEVYIHHLINCNLISYKLTTVDKKYNERKKIFTIYNNIIYNTNLKKNEKDFQIKELIKNISNQ